MKLEFAIPKGFRRLRRNEIIRKGDLWPSGAKKVWLSAGIDTQGERVDFTNGDLRYIYIRRIKAAKPSKRRYIESPDQKRGKK